MTLGHQAQSHSHKEGSAASGLRPTLALLSCGPASGRPGSGPCRFAPSDSTALPGDRHTQSIPLKGWRELPIAP